MEDFAVNIGEPEDLIQKINQQRGPVDRLDLHRSMDLGGLRGLGLKRSCEAANRFAEEFLDCVSADPEAHIGRVLNHFKHFAISISRFVSMKSAA